MAGQCPRFVFEDPGVDGRPVLINTFLDGEL
jgi:hypothetical protein